MIKFIKQNKILLLILASVFLGFAMGVKVSSIVFLLPLIITAIIKSYPKNLSFKTLILFIKQALKRLLRFTSLTLAIIIITAAAFAFVAPYVFLDFPSFQGNLEYEGGLALGKFPAFYTRQFMNTMPVLFQTEKILPYALGPFLLLFSFAGFMLVIINQIIKSKKEVLIIIVAFLSLLIPNAFLFAKWTRFIAPTFPFFAIFAAFLLQELGKKMRFTSSVFEGILVVTTLLWTMAFFSIYTNPDIRIIASAWLESYAKAGSTFLVEGGNTVDLPLGGNFQRTSLDFYSLENDPLTREKIINAIQSSDYFLVQSRRVFYNHQRLPTFFPKTSNFYNALFDDKMGFTQIKEFNSYPMLEIACSPMLGFCRRGNLKLEFPDEKAEETWSVFDHPVIRIFKKTKQLSTNEYEKFLE